MTVDNKPFAGAHPSSLGYAETFQALRNKGTMLSLVARNKSTTVTYYLMIFDQVTAVAALTIPAYVPIPLVPGGYYESLRPRRFEAGCWVVVSTNQTNYSAPGVSDVWMEATLG